MSHYCLKNLQRLKFQKKRKKVIPPSHLSQVIQNYIRLFDWPSSYKVASYYPLEGEMDLRCLHQKYSYILYPAVKDSGLKFVFAHIRTHFTYNSLFYEPADGGQECPVTDIDVFFVPGLAFDRTGVRLGRGRGFYDRLLSQSQRSLKIGTAWSVQVSTENLPQSSEDIAMDMLMTEKFLLFTKDVQL